MGPRDVLGSSLTWAIAQVGFPIVVALLLLGALLGVIPSTFTDLARTLRAHASGDLERIGLLRQICYNTARTDKQKVRCLRAEAEKDDAEE